MSLSPTLPPDRLVIQALKSGVQSLQASRPLFEKLLGGYPADEQARAWARFTAHPPAVRSAFARPDSPFPVWAVVLGDETPDAGALGEFLGVDESFGANGAEMLGGTETQRLQLYLCCEHPDETRYHHALCKALMRGNLRWLMSQGIINFAYAGARDLHPEQAWLPSHVFVRQQLWSLGHVAVAYEEIGAPKSKVYVFLEGISVDGREGGVVPVSQ